jgi:hypothetical protein
MWPSGKAPVFDTGMRRFDSCHPNQLFSSPRLRIQDLAEDANNYYLAASVTLFNFAKPFSRSFATTNSLSVKTPINFAIKFLSP